MLLCGSDLLESFSVPGVWVPEQVYFLSVIDIEGKGPSFYMDLLSD